MKTASELAGLLRGRSKHEEPEFVEEMGAFSFEGASLLSIIVEPRGSLRKTGLVVCPASFEEREFQRWEVGLVRRAATAGFPAIYHQPPGTGDSEGGEAATVDQRVRSAGAAADRLFVRRPELEECCFFGPRLGGAVAVLAARGRGADCPLILWDPVFDSTSYWNQVKRMSRVSAVKTRGQPDDIVDDMVERGWTSVMRSRITEEWLEGLRAADELPTQALGGRSPCFVGGLYEEATEKLAEIVRAWGRPVTTYDLARPDRREVGLWHGTDELTDATVSWMTDNLA